MGRAVAVHVRSLVSELRRRRVFRVAAVYVVGAFAALQGADILAPALHLPDGTMTVLVVLAILGLPVALGLSWVFDLGPGGIERTPPAVAASALVDRGDAALPGPGPVSATDTPRVAVLPFLNLSPDPDNEYFADGITEDVIAHLSKISALRVISRASVMHLKKRQGTIGEMARRLGATTVLDGSVRRNGDRVRIVAQLVDAATDRHLWAEIYDRELTDIFAIQTDVALHIATALEAELSADERTRIRREATTSMEAYQLSLKGRHHFLRFTPEGQRRSIEFFRRAIEVDPSYALAYAQMALAYTELADSGAMPGDEARPGATRAADTALRLDPLLAEAHYAAGYVRAVLLFDWEGAEAAYRRAIELCPSCAEAYDLYGRLCSGLGRYDDALALVRKAQALDPFTVRVDLANVLLRAGRYDEALPEATAAMEFDPEYDRAQATLGWAYLRLGRTDDGIAALRRAVELAPDYAQWTAQLGQALAEAGRVDEARAVLRDLEERAATGFVAPYHLAFVHTGLGDHGRAIDLLERALEAGDGAVYAVGGSFLFTPLRSHPRFQSLLERIASGRRAGRRPGAEAAEQRVGAARDL